MLRMLAPLSLRRARQGQESVSQRVRANVSLTAEHREAYRAALWALLASGGHLLAGNKQASDAPGAWQAQARSVGGQGVGMCDLLLACTVHCIDTRVHKAGPSFVARVWLLTSAMHS